LPALKDPANATACASIDALIRALDETIPLPERAVDRPFLMPVEGVHSITGRGTVATGKIERGRIRKGDTIEIVGLGAGRKAVVTDIEQFNAEVYVLTKEEGGRHTPFFSGYRPQFFFRTANVTGQAFLPDEGAMVMPGDTVRMRVELGSDVAIEERLKFAIREGGRTVGSGVVTELIA